MNKITDAIPAVSFEFFPPQNEKAEVRLWQSIDRLKGLHPRFVSVTYGADGSTRERTHNAVARLMRETSLTTAPHLTCVGADRGEIDDIARQYWDMGVRHLVALRGDPPKGAGAFQPHPQGFASSVDLVEALAATGRFDIRVGAYPDPHRDGHIAFHGDCDTAIIKGVLALLIQLCSGKTAQEIQELDMDEVFRRLQLDEHLSPNRHVGVYAMFDLMKQKAHAADKAACAA